jgi:hypothetical protein
MKNEKMIGGDCYETFHCDDDSSSRDFGKSGFRRFHHVSNSKAAKLRRIYAAESNGLRKAVL